MSYGKIYAKTHVINSITPLCVAVCGERTQLRKPHKNFVLINILTLMMLLCADQLLDWIQRCLMKNEEISIVTRRVVHLH